MTERRREEASGHGPEADGPSAPGNRSLYPEDPSRRSAADDPTAVWDEEAVEPDRVGGAPPATSPAVGGRAASPGVLVETGDGSPHAPDGDRHLSWGATVAIALGLGVAVFLIFYNLR